MCELHFVRGESADTSTSGQAVASADMCISGQAAVDTEDGRCDENSERSGSKDFMESTWMESFSPLDTMEGVDSVTVVATSPDTMEGVESVTVVATSPNSIDSFVASVQEQVSNNRSCRSCNTEDSCFDAETEFNPTWTQGTDEEPRVSSFDWNPISHRGTSGEFIAKPIPIDKIYKGRYRLRVEVLCAAGLGRPAYRFGDIASTLVCGMGASLASVYVTVDIGAQSLQTRTADNPNGEREVQFREEKMLFHYSGEDCLIVRALDHRRVQSVMGGDPLIGQGMLPLNPEEMSDSRPRSVYLQILRGSRFTSGSRDAGRVLLRLQIVGKPDCDG